jgi:hypothetical protein
MTNAYNILQIKLQKKGSHRRYRRRWEDMLKWVLETYGEKMRTGFIWLRIGLRDGLRGCDNKPASLTYHGRIFSMHIYIRCFDNSYKVKI